MIDLGTLESLSDRQILFKLIGLVTSLIAVQHRDRSPSSTPCRNGSACSFRPRCWFSHAAPHTVRRSGTPLPATVSSQRTAAAWRTTSRPSTAKTRLTSAPSPARSFSLAPPADENTFGPLAPRRRRRRNPQVPRSTAGRSSDSTSVSPPPPQPRRCSPSCRRPLPQLPSCPQPSHSS